MEMWRDVSQEPGVNPSSALSTWVTLGELAHLTVLSMYFLGAD